MTSIVILMAVYNGARFLQAQLDSIASQSHQDWRLLASDDGSTDASPDLLQAFAAKWPAGQVTLLRGPHSGAVANFRFLIQQAAQHGAGVRASLAFCDQDDVWQSNHLAQKLDLAPATPRPILAGGRMVYVDAALQPLGLSPLPQRAPDFGNALVQNVLSGNTMLMNPAAAALLIAAEAEAGPFVLHDWWAYQLLSGAGAQIAFDPEPTVLYRQHGSNLVGANSGIAALPQRLRRHLSGAHARWHRLNASALAASAHRLERQNRLKLQAFQQAQMSRGLQRLRLLQQAGVWHQSRKATLAFWISALLGLS
ncbi:glycosyltransferase [Xinfangfangia sp. CPCC 101601]|uniref:Glycosyltransferase n=1 Tax=Pseudogemmobacter lacusdianii TaxID=3069608 RepID=A0ABU0VZS8_9RHOB|nr:glycosyltransferase [Xinfangfangia sp. CPCC 101601]MDQ2067251.1 glycosyltransferase [Xinfangfangia sp. CPCC 101601]